MPGHKYEGTWIKTRQQDKEMCIIAGIFNVITKFKLLMLVDLIIFLLEHQDGIVMSVSSFG